MKTNIGSFPEIQTKTNRKSLFKIYFCLAVNKIILTLLLLDNNPGYPTTQNYLNENVAYFKTSGFRRLNNI